MKPEYKIPTMAQIAAIPWNGYNVVSTFSGCGGSCLGFKMAGFHVIYASEFIPAAAEVYRLNHPEVPLDTRDIRKVGGSDLSHNRDYLDVLEGSPPCSDFSSSGKREEGWGKVKKYSDTEQRVDDLFFEYVRLVRELQPKVFVAENVAGLVRGKATGIFLEVRSKLARAGYNVSARLLDAQWLGVPQTRQRVIIIGVRRDLGLDPLFPKPFPFGYSFREALRSAVGPPEPETDIRRYAIAKEWKRIAPGQQSKKYFNLVKPHPDLPCPAILATAGITGAAGVVHPHEMRKLSIEEAKLICGFPADFKLTGTFQQKWERLGRAVPPLMMKEIALCVLDVLKRASKQQMNDSRETGS